MGKWVAIALGGAFGTCLRAAVSAIVPADRFFLATLFVNLTGAFLLAYCTERWISSGKWRPELTFFLSTGALGSFTTVSAFTTDSIRLLSDSLWTGSIYIFLTLIFGLISSVCGIALGNRRGTG